MDPDSKLGFVLRICPYALAGFISLLGGYLCWATRLTGQEFINVLGFVGTLVGVTRMMALPSSTTTTKETDPTTGKTTETKVNQPLGMPPAPVATPPPTTGGKT